MKLRKYMVCMDDGHDVFKAAIPAESEESARKWCRGNGEIIAIKDFTDEESRRIKAEDVSRALAQASIFDNFDINIIIRTLTETGITE